MFMDKMRARRRRHDMMESMMESPIIKMMAVGALVYVGAKAIRTMMDD